MMGGIQIFSLFIKKAKQNTTTEPNGSLVLHIQTGSFEADANLALLAALPSISFQPGGGVNPTTSCSTHQDNPKTIFSHFKIRDLFINSTEL